MTTFVGCIGSTGSTHSRKLALKGVKNAHRLTDNVIPQSLIRLPPER
jgi:hypothetical protein